MITVVVYDYDDYNNKIISKKVLQGDSMDAIYRQFYELQRGYRYMNCRTWKFFNDYDKEFLEWKSKNETIEMFYGGGCVYD